MGFEYKGRSAESIKREAEATTGNYDDYLKPGTNKFKARDGDNAIRILPGNSSWDNKIWGDGWALELWLHQNIGVDKTSYLCAAKMLGKACAVCDARENVLDDKEEADALRPVTRRLVTLIDRYAEKEGPLIWSMPFSTVAKEIALRSADRKTGAAVLIDDPDKGYDVLFRKTGSQRNTDYTGIEIDREPSYLCENEKRQNEWLEWMMEHPLPDLLVFYPYEYLEKVVKGQVSRRESDKQDKDDRGRGRGGEERGSSRGRGDRTEEVEDRRGGRDRGGRDDRDEDRGRGRGDRDEDRGRGRGEEAEDRGGRRSSRDEPEDTGRGRGRGEEPAEDRGGRRSSREEEPPRETSRGRGREEEDDRSNRRGGRDSEPEPERESRRSSRGEDPKDEESDRRGSSRRGSRDEEKDSGKGKDEDKGGGNRRRSSRDAAEDDETTQAKEAIGGLRDRGGRGSR